MHYFKYILKLQIFCFLKVHYLVFCVWSECMELYHVHAWCLRRPAEGVMFAGGL